MSDVVDNFVMMKWIFVVTDDFVCGEIDDCSVNVDFVCDEIDDFNVNVHYVCVEIDDCVM